MTAAQKYLIDHKTELARFFKHIAPYIAIIMASLSLLADGGWLDAPARSSIVDRIIVEVGALKGNVYKLQDTTKKTSVSNAVTAEKLRSIDRRIKQADGRLKSMNGKLDRIIDRMIPRRE